MNVFPEVDEKTAKWLAKRKKAGAVIDPGTAEVNWRYGQSFDPYGVYSEIPEEYQQIQRHYFARSPGSKIWVCFDDLPKKVYKELWKRHGRKLVFPAGLF